MQDAKFCNSLINLITSKIADSLCAVVISVDSVCAVVISVDSVCAVVISVDSVCAVVISVHIIMFYARDLCVRIVVVLLWLASP